MKRVMLVATVIGVFLTGCGDDPSASPTLTPAESEPTATASAEPSASETAPPLNGILPSVLARVSTSNGSLPPPYGIVTTTDMVLLADGTVLTPDGSEIAEIRLSTEGTDAVQQELIAADLGRFVDFEPSGGPPTGAETTTIIVDVDDGEPVEVVAYALGAGWPEEVRSVVARLEALAAEALASTARRAPDHVLVYSYPLFGSEPVGPVMPWPDGAPVPDGVDQPDDAMSPLQSAYAGDEAAAVIEAFGGEEFAVWTLPEPDRDFQVAWVPLLP